MAPKFRAWDRKNKVMRDVKGLIWEETDLIGHCNLIAHCPPRGHEFNEWFTVALDGSKYQLMQSTGLKDKNGLDIFEGDVLLHTSSSVNYSDTYWHSYVQVYRMDSGAYRIKGKHIYDTELMSARNRLEVVGNIYQNQNLLDKEYFSTSDGIVVQANES